jgi:hypothetical protein
MLREQWKEDPKSGCWLWQHWCQKGYGVVEIRGKRSRAHRFLWELYNGPVPSGFELHHRCQSKSCCNPAYLILISKTEHRKLHGSHPNNITTRYRNKTHCDRGHPFDDLNIIKRKDGKARTCRVCNIERVKAYRARQKAKATTERRGVKVALVFPSD